MFIYGDVRYVRREFVGGTQWQWNKWLCAFTDSPHCWDDIYTSAPGAHMSRATHLSMLWQNLFTSLTPEIHIFDLF